MWKNLEKQTVRKVEDRYELVEPEDIRSDKATVPYLVIQQLNRINYLFTLVLSRPADGKKGSNQITSAVLFGLRTVESMMSSQLRQDYYDEVRDLKNNLPQQLLNATVDDNLFKWYDLLVKNFGRIGLGVVEKVTYDFSDKPPKWD